MFDFIVGGTGHRPPKLGIGYGQASNVLLTDFVRAQLEGLPKSVGRSRIDAIISGFANGFDQALAEAAIILGIPLIAALPFIGQEVKWPPEGQARFNSLLSYAYQSHFVCEDGYAAWKFIRRDEWIVNNSSLLMALYDEKETKSGTGQTVSYAYEKKVAVLNIWPEWLAWPKTTPG